MNVEMRPAAEQPSIQSVIDDCAILQVLSAEDRASLAAASAMHQVKRGDFIWHSGAPARWFGIVGTGFVKMVRTISTGTEVAIDLIGPGKYLGLLVAIEGHEYPLSAVALTPVWYVRVPADAFMEVYRSSSDIKDKILLSLAPRIRRAHEMMARMSMGRVEQRIAALLLMLADSYGEPAENGVRLTVPLTRQELAELAGTTVETSIRTMSRLQKEGAIATDHQFITVINSDLLSETIKSSH